MAKNIVIVNKTTEAKFAEKRIFFTNKSGLSRLKSGEKLSLSDNVTIEPYTAFLKGLNLFTFGAFSYSWSTLPVDTVVGRYCSIARDVSMMGVHHPIDYISGSSFIYDSNFPIYSTALSDMEVSDYDYPVKTNRSYGRLVIENNVWIGGGAVLRGGITIGSGSVIGAHTVVTKDVPPFSIVVGNPGRVIKMRFDEALVERLVASKWWDYAFPEFRSMPKEDPARFLDSLDERKANGTIEPFQPLSMTAKDIVDFTA